jgi:hypothetical protein
MSTSGSLRHLHAIGPTGTGKSTLLLNLITQDMEDGRSVVVIEPKGDLIDDVLKRIPESRLDDVILLDPNDKRFPVGLNPLAPSGRSPEAHRPRIEVRRAVPTTRRYPPVFGKASVGALPKDILVIACVHTCCRCVLGGWRT